MHPELQSYLEQCREHGMSDAQIKQDLISTGWQETDLEGLFQKTVAPPTLPTQPVQNPSLQEAVPAPVHEPADKPEPEPVFPSTKSRKMPRTSLLIGGGVALLVLLLIGGVVLAEEGYWPAFSRLYRKTELPLLWHGTTANAALAMAQGVSKSLAAKPIAVTSAIDLTAGFNPQDLTKLSLKATNLAGGQMLADVTTPASSTSPTTQTLKFKLTNTLGVDKDNNVYESYSYPLSDISGLISFAGSYLNPTFTTMSFDSVFPGTGNTAYVRSNALPVPTSADQEKWFSFHWGSGNTVITTQNKTVQDLTNNTATRTTLMNLINTVTVDHGIIRHDNLPEAWYTSTLTPQNIGPFETNSAVPQTIRDALKSDLTGWTSGKITIDWYVTARSPELKEVAIAVQNVVAGSSSLNGTIDTTFADGVSVKALGIPAKSDIWSSPEAYEQALMSAGDAPFSTGILSGDTYNMIVGTYRSLLGMGNDPSDDPSTMSTTDTQNAERQSDITEYGKALTLYQTAGGALPDTKGAYIRLDSASSPLCALGTALSIECVMTDSDPQYYYSYWSDGTDYRVVAVHEDADGTMDGFYVNQDGSVSQVATLP